MQFPLLPYHSFTNNHEKTTEFSGYRERQKKNEASYSKFRSFVLRSPAGILLNIIPRLSIKRILVCKCVCKTWYDLVSDPEFSKLHFDQAQVYPLIQKYHSSTVYLVQPDKDDFELKLGMCECDHTQFKSGCVCNVRVKLNPTFSILERKKKDKIYSIVNSCKGLICFYNKSGRRPHIVCNPITGEFIELPMPRKVDTRSHQLHYGLGFSPGSNQYKVIRMFQLGDQNSAQVHILGTKEWKCIGFFTEPMPELFCAYLNGFLYWSSKSQRLSVFTFDIENESFGSISARVDKTYLSSNIGVLGEELCIFRFLWSGRINVWAWKDQGTEKAWSKVFSFKFPYTCITRSMVSFQPIKYLNDGALLTFHAYRDSFFSKRKGVLLYMDPKRKQFKCLEIQGMDRAPKVISYAPSFVSLKHALTGQNAKVLNVTSRCAGLKPYKKADNITIVEEEYYNDCWTDYDSVSSFDSD